jgi:hypothetical protein
MQLFKDSFQFIRRGLVLIDNLPSIEVGVMLKELVRKETSESYSLLESLGDQDSYPNIDSSYVYVDQLHNPDFFDKAALLLYEWCLKNDK